MPPKRSRLAEACQSRSPCVMLGPLHVDQPQLFTTTPAITSLYNRIDTSDIKIIVNDNCYFAHRLVLSAASEVFAKMLSSKSSWKESSLNELILQEEDDCSKVFDNFLYYMYSGSIVISDQHAIPLFVLSDKYNVKPLYDECVKVIEKGLKVYTVMEPSTIRSANYHNTQYFSSKHSVPATMNVSSSNSSSSSSTDGSDSASISSSDEEESNNDLVLHLVGNETFPMSLVIKMLAFCHNEVIAAAAQKNLQARLKNQLQNANYVVWNDLPMDLLTHMLADDYFYCDEYNLFKAAKSWLCYKPGRTASPSGQNTIKQVLCLIRYATLSTEDLCHIDKDDMVTNCPDVLQLVNHAIRFKLFSSISTDDKWNGSMFVARKARSNNT